MPARKLVKKKAARKQLFHNEIRKNYFFFDAFFATGALAFFCLMTACAAASRAIGTLKGEQLT